MSPPPSATPTADSASRLAENAPLLISPDAMVLCGQIRVGLQMRVTKFTSKFKSTTRTTVRKTFEALVPTAWWNFYIANKGFVSFIV